MAKSEIACLQLRINKSQKHANNALEVLDKAVRVKSELIVIALAELIDVYEIDKMNKEELVHFIRNYDYIKKWRNKDNGTSITIDAEVLERIASQQPTVKEQSTPLSEATLTVPKDAPNPFASKKPKADLNENGIGLSESERNNMDGILAMFNAK